MTIGENIRKRRIELGMSQQQIADALGYRTRSSITKIEKNEAPVSPDKLPALARILQIDVNYILTGEITSGNKHGSLLSEDELEALQLKSAEQRKCAAIILAGGRNRINRYSIPFQFVTVKEKPVICYTMEAFQRHPMINDIYVVCLEGWEDLIPAYADQYGITKFRNVIQAGKSGICSVKNAVEWLASSYYLWDILLLQEATRPFVEPEMISNTILCCKQYGSAVTFERMDTMTPFYQDKENSGLCHLDAYKLINIQSPEAYTMGLLRQTFSAAMKAQHELTETICAVFLHHMGRDLKFCEGSHSNIRIVFEEDLKIMEALV